MGVVLFLNRRNLQLLQFNESENEDREKRGRRYLINTD